VTVNYESVQAACRLVAEALNRPEGDIAPEASIHTIPAWDSLGHVRVLLAIESAIGRPLSSDAIATVISVADIAAILAVEATGGQVTWVADATEL
jgi:acyl carrier protein